MRYLLIPEVAAIIREEPDSVRRRCATGQLKATKVGGSWRITDEDLTLFMTPTNIGSPRKRLTTRQRRQLSA